MHCPKHICTSWPEIIIDHWIDNILPLHNNISKFMAIRSPQLLRPLYRLGFHSLRRNLRGRARHRSPFPRCTAHPCGAPLIDYLIGYHSVSHREGIHSPADFTQVPKYTRARIPQILRNARALATTQGVTITSEFCDIVRIIEIWIK